MYKKVKKISFPCWILIALLVAVGSTVIFFQWFLAVGLTVIFFQWFLALAALAVAVLFVIPYALNKVGLAGLSDDMVDSLSSEENRPSFVRVLKRLFQLKNQGKYVTILSGDIHLAGISEFIQIRNGKYSCIPQIVSSPIGNNPMHKLVEGFTTTTSEMEFFCSGDEKIIGRNLFYLSKRNFVKIYPEYLGKIESRRPILFYFEGHELPMAWHESSVGHF